MKRLALALIAALASGCTLNLTDARARAQAAEDDGGAKAQPFFEVLYTSNSQGVPVGDFADVAALIPDGDGGLWAAVSLSEPGAILNLGETPISRLDAQAGKASGYTLVHLQDGRFVGGSGTLPQAPGAGFQFLGAGRADTGDLYIGVLDALPACAVERFASDGQKIASDQAIIQTNAQCVFGLSGSGESAFAAFESASASDGGRAVVHVVAPDLSGDRWSTALTASKELAPQSTAFQGGRLFVGGFYLGDFNGGAAGMPSCTGATCGFVAAFNPDGGFSQAVGARASLGTQVIQVAATDAGLLVGGVGFGDVSFGASGSECSCPLTRGLFVALLDVDDGLRCLGMACVTKSSPGFSQFALTPENTFLIGGGSAGATDAGLPSSGSACDMGVQVQLDELALDGGCLGATVGGFWGDIDALSFLGDELWVGGQVNDQLDAPTLTFGDQAAANPFGDGGDLGSTAFILHTRRPSAVR